MSLAQRILAHPEALPKAAPAAGGGGGGGAPGGLGFVVGGLGKLGMGALSALDYPRAAVTSGVRELLDTAAAEELNQALAKLPGVEYSPIQAEDAEASWGDWWRQTKEHKGFGELIVEPAMGEEGTDRNIWARRALGFAGDVAADPFSYLTAGTGATAGKAARSNYLNALLDAQQAAARDVDLVDDLTRQWARRAGGMTPELEAASQAARAEAQAARTALGTIEDVEQMGRRGVNIASPEQLRAMGIDQHALRIGGRGGIAIPGTQGISRGVARATAPIKQAISAAPGMRGVRALTPKGVLDQDLRAAMERMVAGRGAMTTEESLRTMALNELQRQAKGAFRGPAIRALDQFSRQIKEMTPAERAAAIRQAEEEGADNVMTAMAPMMRDIAAEIGVELPELKRGRYVIPHVLSRDAFNWLNKLRKGEDPIVEGFKTVAGITDRDLLEEGGFLQRRAFVPGTTHKIGEHEITIDTGSLSELEDKLGGLLRGRGFKGQLYETNPVEAWKRYIGATERDVAKRFSAIEGARRGYPGLHKVGKAPGFYDPYGGRTKLPPTGEPDEVERWMATANRRPEPAETEFFEMRETAKSKAKTRKRNRQLSKRGGEQRKILAETVQAAADEREVLAAQLEDVAKQAWAPIGEAKQAARQAERDAVSRVVNALEGAATIDAKRGEYRQAVAQIDARIRQLRGQIGGLTSGVRRRAKAENRALLTSLQDDLDEAIANRNRLDEAFRAAQARDKANAINAQDIAEGTRTKAIEAERERLTRAEAGARANRGDALYRARQEVERRIGSKGEAGRVISKREYENAISQLRHLWSSKAADQYRALDAEAKRVAQARAKALDRVAAFDQQAKELRSQLKARNLNPRLRAEIQQQLDRAEWVILNEGNKADNMQAQITALRSQINQHDITRLSVVKNAYEDQEARIARFAGATGERGARRHVDVPAAESRWAAAKRAIDEFEAATVEEAQRAAPTAPRPETLLNEAEQAELAAARKLLEGPRARDYTVAREQQPRLQQARDEAAAEVERLSKTRAKKALSEAREKLRRAQDKLDEVDAELARSPRNANRIARAEETVARLTAEDAQRLAAEQPPEVGRLPFFEQTEAAERAAFERARDLAKRETETTEFFVPKVREAETGVTGARQAYTEAIREAPAVKQEALQRGVNQADVKRAEIEGMERAKDTYQMIDDQLAEQQGVQASNYRQALQDREAARARHAEISAKAEPLRKPVSPTTIIEESKKAGAPSKADLERVLTGDMVPYQAQPLQRTVDDVRKVIEANPTGDDELVNRIEAALIEHEQKLAALTTETDIKAHQLNKIIVAANRGELAPILQGQLRSAFRYVWDGGDIVIAKDLNNIYFDIAEQLDSKLFGRTFTAFTNFFKTYATLSPGFHVRNAISAIFMNATEGVTLAEDLRALRLWRQYAKSDDPLQWLRGQTPAVRRAFDATFASGAGGQFTEAGVSEVRGGAGRFMERVYANRVTKGSQRIGQDWVEGPVRLALALNSTAKGASFNDALARVTRIHFDYSQVSKFDENMKRLIPFWTFMSRNVPLQFTQMWTKPKMYLRYQSLVRNLEMGSEPIPFLPRYIAQAGGINIGEETPAGLPGAATGMPIVFQPGLPQVAMQEDIRRMQAALSGENRGQIFSDVNPLLTTLPEFALGKDFYTGKSYGPEDVTQAKGLNIPVAALLSLVGQAQRGPDGKLYINDNALNALRGLNPILDRQMRLAPQLTGGIEKQGADRQLESWLRFMGAPIRTISESQQQGEQIGQYYDQLDAAKLRAAMGG